MLFLTSWVTGSTAVRSLSQRSVMVETPPCQPRSLLCFSRSTVTLAQFDITGRVLEIPVHVAGLGVPGNRAVGVEVVARPIERIEHRHRIAGTPDSLVGVGVVGPGDPHGGTTGLP